MLRIRSGDFGRAVVDLPAPAHGGEDGRVVADVAPGPLQGQPLERPVVVSAARQRAHGGALVEQPSHEVRPEVAAASRHQHRHAFKDAPNAACSATGEARQHKGHSRTAGDRGPAQPPPSLTLQRGRSGCQGEKVARAWAEGLI